MQNYNALHMYNKERYGGKVFKAVIDGGFTCPNIDGSKGTGGCIFCDGGSGYFTHGGSVEQQLEREIIRIKDKHSNAKVIAYFQANTNTYAPVDVLKERFEAAIRRPEVIGLAIGTRADCLSDGVLEYLVELSRKTDLTVELGLQTVHDETLRLINRRYTHEEFLDGYNRLKSAGIRICLHIINGLPYETLEMMIETARQAGIMRPDAVKIQMLHVIRGTALHEQLYGKFRILELNEYIETVVRQLEYFSPETVIERITGDGDKSKLVAPLWSADKIAVLGGIDKAQRNLNSRQGMRFSEGVFDENNNSRL